MIYLLIALPLKELKNCAENNTQTASKRLENTIKAMLIFNELKCDHNTTTDRRCVYLCLSPGYIEHICVRRMFIMYHGKLNEIIA